MPWEILIKGPLFEAVQSLRLFKDSKTFPDMIPKKLDNNKKIENFVEICQTNLLNPFSNFRKGLEDLHPKYDYDKFIPVTGLGEGIISFRSRLNDFIDENFQGRSEEATSTNGIPQEPTSSMESYIDSVWAVLKRDRRNLPEEMFNGTLVKLDFPYVVAGGRFDEVYYWDAYFTGEGLVLSGYLDLFDCMVKNYATSIDKHGFVPNGNRRYYETRSQPPFFCSMVDLLVRMKGLEYVKKARIEYEQGKEIGYIDMVAKEYEFWLGGEVKTNGNAKNERSVSLDDEHDKELDDEHDKKLVLSRYWDHYCDPTLSPDVQPRPEAYHEDIAKFAHTNKHMPQDASIFFRHIRAAAESGWDFSSRWFMCEPEREGGVERGIAKIRTTEILPVDLNALLFGMEKKLYKWTGEPKYKEAAKRRKEAIIKYFWNDELGWFFDYWYGDGSENFEGSRTDVWSLAGAYPLFTELFDPNEQDEMDKVAKIVRAIREKFLRPGGVVTTLLKTGEQWDCPNGWAPLQWIVVRGLLNYGERDLAFDIAKRFVACVGRTYKKRGHIMEKYNVCEPDVIAGGGEYIVQHGFGWTNGIVKALINEFRVDMEKDDELRVYLG